MSNTNSATSFERIKTPFHNTKKKAISRFKYCFCSCETQGVLVSDNIFVEICYCLKSEMRVKNATRKGVFECVFENMLLYMVRMQHDVVEICYCLKSEMRV